MGLLDKFAGQRQFSASNRNRIDAACDSQRKRASASQCAVISSPPQCTQHQVFSNPDIHTRIGLTGAAKGRFLDRFE
jgi:hypothetical protein